MLFATLIDVVASFHAQTFTACAIGGRAVDAGVVIMFVTIRRTSGSANSACKRLLR